MYVQKHTKSIAMARYVNSSMYLQKVVKIVTITAFGNTLCRFGSVRQRDY